MSLKQEGGLRRGSRSVLTLPGGGQMWHNRDHSSGFEKRIGKSRESK